MRENGIPTDALESGKRKILVVDDDVELVELITDVLDRDGRFEVRSVNNGFDAGMMVKGIQAGPDCTGCHAPRYQRQRGLPAGPE